MLELCFGAGMGEVPEGLHVLPLVTNQINTNLLMKGASRYQKWCGHAACFKCMVLLGNGIMGACFQAPCAAPGQ